MSQETGVRAACYGMRQAYSGAGARPWPHAAGAAVARALRARASWSGRGFTLIELMIVIAIMGIVMTMGAPAIYHIWKKESLRKSVADVMEACSRARALAIMQGSQAELVFYAGSGRFEVAGAKPKSSQADSSPPVDISMAGPNSGMSGKFPDSVAIAALKINGINYMDADEGRVRFYPNGTCDELRLILLQPQDGDMRGIFLEITTGLASMESDRFKLQSELK